MNSVLAGVDEIVGRIREQFEELDAGREEAFAISRQVIRVASTCIKSTHRGQFAEANQLLQEAASLNARMLKALECCQQLRWGGFVSDAQKEYAEAAIVLACITGTRIPSPDEMEVDYGSWLNGLAEAAGELRRHVLDLIRRDEIDKAERFLDAMEDIYHITMGFDYPNAICIGLRQRSDAVRGFLERTRGDVTNALRQRQLENRMSELQKAIRRLEHVQTDPGEATQQKPPTAAAPEVPRQRDPHSGP